MVFLPSSLFHDLEQLIRLRKIQIPDLVVIHKYFVMIPCELSYFDSGDPIL